MILDATDHESRTLPLLEDACLIGKQGIPDVIGQPRLAMLRAENQIDQILDQRLWHRVCPPRCSALQGLLVLEDFLPRAALRLRRSALPWAIM